MSRASSALGGALLVAILAAALLFRGEEGSEPAEPAPGAAEPVDIAHAPPEAPLAPAERSPALDRETSSAFLVRGRLLLAGEERPVPHGTVRILTGENSVDYPETIALLGGEEAVDELRWHGDLEEALRAVGGWKAAYESRSDVEGRFEIEVPFQHPRFRFEVASDEGAYPRDDRFTLETPSITEGTLVLLLEPAGGVEGTLRTSSGEPVRGGRVALVRRGGPRFPPETPRTADANDGGRFVLRGVPEGEYALVALAEGCGLARREPVDVAKGKFERVDLVLPEECAIEGRVVDPEGRGISRVELRAGALEADLPSAGVSRLRYGLATSGGDGRFRIGSLGPGKHSVAARLRGWIAEGAAPEVDVPPAGTASGMEIVLSRGHVVAGRVVDGNGRGIVGGEVIARASRAALRASMMAGDFQTWDSARGRTDVDGAFRLTGLGPGPYEVVAEVEDFGAVREDDVPEDTETLLLVLAGATGIEGVVRDAAEGKPVRRFFVQSFRVRRHSGGRGRGSDVRRSFFSEDGSFRLLGLAPGTYDLEIEAEGFAQGTRDGIEVIAGEGRAGYEIALERGATIRGRVVEAGSGLPVDGASIQAHLREGFFGRRFDARSTKDGAFELKGLPSGMFGIEVDRDGYVHLSLQRVDVHPGEAIEEFVVELSRGGAVDGFALDEGGAPYAGGRVRLSRIGPGMRLLDGSVDASGYFLVKGVESGEWEVGVTPSSGRPGFVDLTGHKEVLRARVQVEDGRTTRVEFTPLRALGCTVIGRVLRSGVPVAGAEVAIRNEARADGSAVRTARSAEDGAFALEGVPPGPARLHATVRAEGKTTSRGWRLAVPDAPEFRFDALLPSGGISGRVVEDSSGAAVARAEVRAQWIGADPEFVAVQASTATDESGRFALEGLASGAYRLEVAPQGEAEVAPAAREPVEVVEGSRTTVDFALREAGVALVEVRDPEGEPVPGIMVTLRPGDEATARAATRPGIWFADAEGIARIPRVAPGLYYAAVRAANFANAFSEKRETKGGDETRFEVRLRAGTRITVRVLDTEGEPLRGAKIDVRDDQGRETSAWTGPSDDGRERKVELTILPGDYDLEIAAEGFETKRESVRVDALSDQEFSFTLVVKR